MEKQVELVQKASHSKMMAIISTHAKDLDFEAVKKLYQRGNPDEVRLLWQKSDKLDPDIYIKWFSRHNKLLFLNSVPYNLSEKLENYLVQNCKIDVVIKYFSHIQRFLKPSSQKILLERQNNYLTMQYLLSESYSRAFIDFIMSRGQSNEIISMIKYSVNLDNDIHTQIIERNVEPEILMLLSYENINKENQLMILNRKKDKEIFYMLATQNLHPETMDRLVICGTHQQLMYYFNSPTFTRNVPLHLNLIQRGNHDEIMAHLKRHRFNGAYHLIARGNHDEIMLQITDWLSDEEMMLLLERDNEEEIITYLQLHSVTPKIRHQILMRNKKNEMAAMLMYRLELKK